MVVVAVASSPMRERRWVGLKLPLKGAADCRGHHATTFQQGSICIQLASQVSATLTPATGKACGAASEKAVMYMLSPSCPRPLSLSTTVRGVGVGTAPVGGAAISETTRAPMRRWETSSVTEASHRGKDSSTVMVSERERVEVARVPLE